MSYGLEVTTNGVTRSFNKRYLRMKSIYVGMNQASGSMIVEGLERGGYALSMRLPHIPTISSNISHSCAVMGNRVYWEFNRYGTIGNVGPTVIVVFMNS